MLKSVKNWFINKCPNHIFPLIANTYYYVSSKEGVKIKRVGNNWLIQRDKIKLLSPTPKFLGFGLKIFENKFERFFKINKGDIALDIGACIGDTTIPMAIKTGLTGKVIAVEPHPINVKYLKFNTAIFKNIEIIEKALWNERKTVKLYLYNLPTGHSIIPSKERNYGVIDVPADTLDNLFNNNKRIDFVKIDVQGAEIQVLQGGSKFFEKAQKLVVETHNRFDVEKRTYPKVLEILRNYYSEIHFCMDNGIVYASQ
ncbi:MAG: FkbM family methyltransferase [Nitrososphaerales archaeon]